MKFILEIDDKELKEWCRNEIRKNPSCANGWVSILVANALFDFLGILVDVSVDGPDRIIGVMAE